jgi:sterol desaturase/sphingolipid hydroxylase (fatty acid hydroxylase superfamily)
MFDFILSGLLYGLLEYGLHRLAHTYKNKRHFTHHIVLKSDNDYRSSLSKSIQMLIVTSPLILYSTIFRYLYIQYVLYEFLHSWIHWHTSSKHPSVKNFIQYHNVHHYITGWNRNYGVLTPFWDHIFGTMSKTYRNRTGFSIYFTFLPYLSFINFWVFGE